MNVEFADLPRGTFDELLNNSDIRTDRSSQLYTPSDALGETIGRLRDSVNETMFACCKDIDDVRSVVSDLVAYYLEEYVVLDDCQLGHIANRIAGLIVKIDYT